MSTIFIKSQLSADDARFERVPAIITHCAVRVVVTDQYRPLTVQCRRRTIIVEKHRSLHTGCESEAMHTYIYMYMYVVYIVVTYSTYMYTMYVCMLYIYIRSSYANDLNRGT